MVGLIARDPRLQQEKTLHVVEKYYETSTYRGGLKEYVMAITVCSRTAKQRMGCPGRQIILFAFDSRFAGVSSGIYWR